MVEVVQQRPDPNCKICQGTGSMWKGMPGAGDWEVCECVKPKPPDGIALQNAEFEAAKQLCEALRIHDTVVVVDDGYPEVRFKYEQAVRSFLDACRANGRIK